MLLRGRGVLLRDLEPADGDRLADLTALDRPWRRTNGPYFGQPSRAELADDDRRFRELAGTDHARLPDPRSMLAICAPGTAAESGPGADSEGGPGAAVLIGLVSWYWESHVTDWRRMGIAIHDEAYWGRGLGTEAMALWTSYLFDHTDALRLDFATYSGNPGMIAVGRRLGFVEEGRYRRARRWAGGVHDAVVMGVLREEWDELRGRWPFTPEASGRRP
ncbi:GNAT family N-acetyltransferase [Pseudactinotalea sp. HY160]|uniref:GNAT family N-acetyltransferase n=1 Tax=Pseudactinotalea sp. HY160 TaxID=2654490 RepID=UPI00128CD395|nr:GNAT family protein [Pseudactinotalea sp. HY160]MPV51347.1 GNAT family N-acetyltransferase [Pseudactinotalea sp. HY160]